MSRSLFALLFFLAQSLEAATVITVAGVPGTAGFSDGPANVATFNRPTWLDIVPDERPDSHAGEIYVVDRANQAIRRISGGAVSTYRVARAYYDATPFAFNFDGPFGGGIVIEPANGGCGNGPYDRGFFVSATGAQQLALVAFSGTLAARDDVSALVGVANAPGAVDGDEVTSQFNTPTALAKSWNYSSSRLSGGSSTMFADRAIYIADTGNNAIRRIRFRLSFEGCPQPKFIDTIASGLNAPRGVAAAPDGSIYVADTGSHTIRRIVDGVVTTVAGEAGVAGFNDGPALAAHFESPSGIDVDAAGNVYIADTGNHTIRVLTNDNRVITIAGTARVAGFADGVNAKFNGPVGVKVARDGSIYVADTSNNAIRRIFIGEPHRRAVGR